MVLSLIYKDLVSVIIIFILLYVVVSDEYPATYRYLTVLKESGKETVLVVCSMGRVSTHGARAYSR